MDDSRIPKLNSTGPADSATSDSDSIDWLAFQYISGEMSPAEADRFEASLATDTAACEAVARQVMICESVATATVHQPVAQSDQTLQTPPARQTVATVTAVSAQAQHSNGNSRTAMFAVAACAACLAMAVWIGISNTPSAHSVAAVDQSPATELVRGWVEAGFGSDDVPVLSIDSLTQPDELTDLESISFESITPFDSVSEFSDDDDSLDSPLVPDWMFAAVEITDDSDLPQENWE